MPQIGKSSRIGSIGNAGKKQGSIGKPTNTYGDLYHQDFEKTKIEYPTTTAP